MTRIVRWKVYAYSGCDTCRKALRFLEENRVPHEVRPIREQPPTVAELKQVLKAVGGDLRRLFNTSGQDYRALGLGAKLAQLSEAEALELLASRGNLVKRPFVVWPGGGLTGFKPDEWRAALAGK